MLHNTEYIDKYIYFQPLVFWHTQTHTHTHAKKHGLFILLLSLHCALAYISAVQQGPCRAFYRIIFSRRYSNDIQCFILFFSKKCISLKGEAACAQNTICAYLKAAKRGKSDIFQWPTQSSSGWWAKGFRGFKGEINHPNTVLLQHWRAKTFRYGLITSQMFKYII